MDALGPQKPALEITWRKLKAQLEGAKSHWGRVRGTIGAVMATLLDLGWRPQT